MSDFGGEGGGYGAGQHPAATNKTNPFGSGALSQAMTGGQPGGLGAGGPHPGMSPPKPPPPPREVGSIAEELFTRPAQDIKKEFGAFLDLNQLLQINPQTDSPEEQARKQQIHSKWQSLTQSQQQVAQANYQHEMQRKQHQQQEEARSRQQAAAKQSVEMPSSPSKGPVGPSSGNRKKTMTQQVNSNRQSFNKMQNTG